MSNRWRHRCAAILVFLITSLPVWVEPEASVKQQIFMTTQLIPSLKKITVICNVTDVQPILKEMKLAAESYGLELSVFDVRSFPEIHRIFRSFSSKTEDLIWMVPDSVAGGDKMARRFLLENSIRKRIPSHAFSADVLREGALLFMSVENEQPVFYVNKAVAGLMNFAVAPAMKSKITLTE